MMMMMITLMTSRLIVQFSGTETSPRAIAVYQLVVAHHLSEVVLMSAIHRPTTEVVRVALRISLPIVAMVIVTMSAVTMTMVMMTMMMTERSPMMTMSMSARVLTADVTLVSMATASIVLGGAALAPTERVRNYLCVFVLLLL